MHIAQTILEQLGGHRFRLMTGSKDFLAVDDGLRFKVGRNGAGVNYCAVSLNGADLYDVEYGYIRAGKMTVKRSSANIYADRLQADFTAATGLYTSLGQ